MLPHPSTPALIFDLDGTLVDTAPDLLSALNTLLVREGRQPVGLSDMRYLIGHGTGATVAEAMRRTGEPASAERLPALIDAFVAHYREHIADESRPFPGVEATLAHFERQGARLGVLTNKPQELADPLLEKLGLTRFFGAVHGAGRLAYAKPDARVFHHVVEELGGVGPGAIMIGDSATDVATARAAGVPVIVLPYGYTPEPAARLGADVVADSFADLPAIVARILAAG